MSLVGAVFTTPGGGKGKQGDGGGGYVGERDCVSHGTIEGGIYMTKRLVTPRVSEVA